MSSEAVLPEPPARVAPPPFLAERAALEARLEFHRATFLVKCAGLDAERLARRACPPSPLSLLGLIRHLTDVERGWWLRRWVDGITPLYYGPDDPDGDVDGADPAGAAENLATYLEWLDVCRAEAARHDLDERVPRSPETTSGAGEIDVRWIHHHLIEEYARHNGHADLLREAIDGSTGE